MEQKICKICGKKFVIMDNGWTRKYCYDCSPHQDENMTHAQAVTIKRRAIKQALVNLKGGKCSICGYNKSLRALQFHHLNPKEKDFALTKNVKDFDKLKKKQKNVSQFVPIVMQKFMSNQIMPVQFWNNH